MCVFLLSFWTLDFRRYNQARSSDGPRWSSRTSSVTPTPILCKCSPAPHVVHPCNVKCRPHGNRAEQCQTRGQFLAKQSRQHLDEKREATRQRVQRHVSCRPLRRSCRRSSSTFLRRLCMNLRTSPSHFSTVSGDEFHSSNQSILAGSAVMSQECCQ